MIQRKMEKFLHFIVDIISRFVFLSYRINER